MSNFFFVGALDHGGWRNELWVSHLYSRLFSGLPKKAEMAAYEASVEKLHRDGLIPKRVPESRYFDDSLREVVQCVLTYVDSRPPIVQVYLGLEGDRADALRQSQRS